MSAKYSLIFLLCILFYKITVSHGFIKHVESDDELSVHISDQDEKDGDSESDTIETVKPIKPTKKATKKSKKATKLATTTSADDETTESEPDETSTTETDQDETQTGGDSIETTSKLSDEQKEKLKLEKIQQLEEMLKLSQNFQAKIGQIRKSHIVKVGANLLNETNIPNVDVGVGVKNTVAKLKDDDEKMSLDLIGDLNPINVILPSSKKDKTTKKEDEEEEEEASTTEEDSEKKEGSKVEVKPKKDNDLLSIFNF